MTEKYDSKFHKQYVSGEGGIEEQPLTVLKSDKTIKSETVEDIRAWYREYVGDPKAELPLDVIKSFVSLGKIKEEDGEA